MVFTMVIIVVVRWVGGNGDRGDQLPLLKSREFLRGSVPFQLPLGSMSQPFTMGFTYIFTSITYEFSITLYVFKFEQFGMKQ